MSDDRRRFSRIPFDAPVRLHQDHWQAQTLLLDISLRGLLLQQPETWNAADSSQPVQVIIELSGLEQIHMEAQPVFSREGLLGLACRHLDLNSSSHLNRLIMLNLGEEALERELAALYDDAQ
ncbi:MAG: PilZ domain-containing protein [Pseudomonas sp.]